MTTHTIGYWENVADNSYRELVKLYRYFQRKRPEAKARFYAARVRKVKAQLERLAFDCDTLLNHVGELK